MTPCSNTLEEACVYQAVIKSDAPENTLLCVRIINSILLSRYPRPRETETETERERERERIERRKENELEILPALCVCVFHANVIRVNPFLRQSPVFAEQRANLETGGGFLRSLHEPGNFPTTRDIARV